MIEVTIHCEVLVGEKVVAEKTFVRSVMDGGVVRSWTRRQFNKTLKTTPPGIVVRARYQGQLAKPPYTMYSGGLAGHTGKFVKAWGEFDEVCFYDSHRHNP